MYVWRASFFVRQQPASERVCTRNGRRLAVLVSLKGITRLSLYARQLALICLHSAKTLQQRKIERPEYL